ncbi:ketopantoate reductase family protein [[Clostridium] polysaccharolyticum]|uniref:Ketopantoate reductase PanE/ApbA n=1 Tax=[Clostridium] polysaccharolyticum TaxID=29364 RepID=A0A1H9ZNM5_9FIRM|nr:2-dehydropantoate 2-reductase N-terminal domain-containing protein [[Clostridium] polysaccharolyticum]SES83243.1 Ketopantoate reductase PanE/ApbA [[Clostridium] polysaccharolyticum]
MRIKTLSIVGMGALGIMYGNHIQNKIGMENVSFVIIATKYNGLTAALEMMKPILDENTIIISVSNGISSEEMIAERIGDKNLVYCVALGMDAMREGTALQYASKGKVQIGILKLERGESL